MLFYKKKKKNDTKMGKTVNKNYSEMSNEGKAYPLKRLLLVSSKIIILSGPFVCMISLLMLHISKVGLL